MEQKVPGHPAIETPIMVSLTWPSIGLCTNGFISIAERARSARCGSLHETEAKDLQ